MHNSALIDHTMTSSIDETTVIVSLVGFGEFAPAAHVARSNIAASAGDRFAPVLRLPAAVDTHASTAGAASEAVPMIKAKALAKGAKSLKRK